MSSNRLLLRRAQTRARLRAAAISFVLLMIAMPLTPAGVATAGSWNDHGRDGHIPCSVAALQATAPPRTVVTSASMVNGAVAYCLAYGHVLTSGPGSNDNPNGFVLALPETFAQRMYFVALGGAAGFLLPPDTTRLQEGYAFASTDAGHQGYGLVDFTFGFDLTKGWDYGFRGNHVTAMATQQITRAYYRLRHHEKLYRYLDGCSGGGRTALLAATLFPDDFDGIIAGCPAGVQNGSNILFYGKLLQFLQNQPEAWIPPEALASIEPAVIEHWDGADGANDGLIADPRAIDPDELVTFVASLGILTDAQLQTVALMVHPFDTGDVVVPGRAAAYVTSWVGLLGTTPPPWTTATQPPLGIAFYTRAQAFFGADFNFYTDFDFSNQDRLRAYVRAENRVFPPDNLTTDLRRFRRLGHKLVLWHGANDIHIPFKSNLKWYGQVARENGDYQATQTFARAFVVPGTFHCGGGPGAQDTATVALRALVRWVERGRKPESLVATATSGRTFLLCPHPSVPEFKGGLDNAMGLDVNSASNWTCSSRRSH